MDNSPQSGETPTLQTSFSFLKEFVFFFILALVIVLPVRIFIAQPYIVSGSSMYPTFQNGNYIIVDQLSYRFDEPRRGDVVIFRFPLEPSKFFIKRIIGLPYETVRIEDDGVHIINEETGNEFVLTESYLEQETAERISMTLEDDEYFVMGDNRSGSLDSRIWGPLPRKNISGRAFLRLFPPTQIDYLPGKADYVSAI